LIGMFVAERRLTIAVLTIVTMAGCLIDFTDLDPLVGGSVVLLGCLILLIESVCRSARAGAATDVPITASPAPTLGLPRH
jgi:hypothetical protein